MKNPRILQEFERRLEGAVEGFFARAFRSGLQPVELAKGVRRYAEEQRQVGPKTVVVPNAYRFRVNPKDADRLAGFGPRLVEELANVVEETARDAAWALPGPVVVEVVPDEEVAYGMFRLVGRVDAKAAPQAAPSEAAAREASPTTSGPATDTSGAGSPGADGPATDGPSVAEAAPAPGTDGKRPGTRDPAATPAANADETDVDMTGAFAKADGTMRLRLPDGNEVELAGARMVAGRLAESQVPVEHATVSRAHAAFVKRGDGWWVLDLGSTNGTKVNGRPAAEHPIHAGDRVELGEAVVEVLGG